MQDTADPGTENMSADVALVTQNSDDPFFKNTDPKYYDLSTQIRSNANVHEQKYSLYSNCY